MRLISKSRPDYVDWGRKIIYELKPMNKRNVKKGIKQLMRYWEELGDEFRTLLKNRGKLFPPYEKRCEGDAYGH